MTPLTAQQLAQATGATLMRASFWLPHLTAAMAKYGIDTPTRVAHFLAQVSVESGRLARTEEELSYSAERLKAVWPSRFKTLQEARQYERNPQALAERVYGGRMGNASLGDGWKYRGRGLKQLTGKANYVAYMLAADVDCLSNPDLLLQPQYAADSAAWFWSSNGCSALADRCDVAGLTRRINGGTNGLEERQAMTAVAMKVLGAVKLTDGKESARLA